MARIQNERVRVTALDAKIFVFGDSLSDSGTLFAVTGNRFPPSPPYFNGRFSNGPLAVEILAGRLGLAVTPITNFAIGGAKSARDNIGDTESLKLGGLLDQVDRFANRVGARGANPRALYFVWAGANDLLSQPPDPVAAVRQAADNIKTAVTTLANLGARTIVVVQNPNLGRTPLSLQAGLLDPLTNTTRALNQSLQSALAPLERRSNLDLILTDLFPISEDIAQNPSRFGFVNVDTAYLQGLVPGNPSADPNQFFFWDQVHPTTRGHSLFANTLRNDVLSGITTAINRVGTLRDDLLVGYSGNDLLQGRAGRDVLAGNRGKDVLLGGLGDDVLKGLQDRDSLLGGFGQDQLQGGTGRDRLFGGAGQDSLIGGNGVDFLSGGLGDDLLNGGGSCDLFSLRPRSGTDTIQDFTPGTDLIVLPGRLSFNQLEVRQQGRNTEISIAGTDQPLAILENVQASSIGASDFLGGQRDQTLLDLANREQGAAILDAIQAESAGLGLNNLLQTH